MSAYLLFLGRKSDLCAAEVFRVLGARYPEVQAARILPGVMLTELSSDEEATKLQGICGGVMKIARVEKQLEATSTENLEKEVSTFLKELAGEKHSIEFGVAEMGRESLDALNLTTIKKLLKADGVSSRFVDGPRFGLSASVLLHQDVEEVVVVKAENQVCLGYTVAVQNIDDWTVRDRAKPFADRRRGMLPPKLARTMLNLAAPGADSKRIYDPFCGTGTVLLEGLLMGNEMLGGDIRLDAVKQTSGNIEWFTKQYPGEYKYSVFLADATQVTITQLGGPVDAIVAEGLLGPLTPTPDKLPNTFKGLEKLYLGALKHWTTILKPGAVLCLALPKVETAGKTYSLASLIDSASVFGYNTLLSPFEYDRPETVVKREIFVLEFTHVTR